MIGTVSAKKYIANFKYVFEKKRVLNGNISSYFLLSTAVDEQHLQATLGAIKDSRSRSKPVQCVIFGV